MMSLLKSRIATQGRNGPDLSIKGRYGTPQEAPLMRIAIYPNAYRYEDMDSLIASDGAPIAATMPGTWGQLYKASRF